MRLQKLKHLLMPGISLLLLNCACDHVFDKPWQRESYIFYNTTQMMRNIVDGSKDKPAKEMDGSICKMPAFELLQEHDAIDCHARLDACEKK